MINQPPPARTRGRPFRVLRPVLVLALLLPLTVSGTRHAHAGSPTPASAMLDQIGIHQKLNAPVPPDIRLTNSNGERVKLGSYLSDRPVILQFVYFDCPMLCGLTTSGLVTALNALSFEPGKEFDILTVSFDHRESPDHAARRKANILTQYKHPSAADGWHVLTGEESEIRRLCDAVGFNYAWDDRTGRYAHSAGLIVLTPEGRVSRYLNGIEYPPRDVRLALVEASQNEIGTATDQVLLFCYQYDPTVGRYGLAIMTVLRAAGSLFALGLAVAVAVLLRREKRSDFASEQSIVLPHS